MWSLYFNRACKALHTMAHVTLAFFLLLDQSTRTLPCPWSFVLFLCDHSLPSTKSAQMRPSLATLSIKPPLVYFSSLLCFPFSSQHLTAWHIILTCSQSISLEHKLCLVQPGSPVLRTVHTGGEKNREVQGQNRRCPPCRLFQAAKTNVHIGFYGKSLFSFKAMHTQRVQMQLNHTTLGQ